MREPVEALTCDLPTCPTSLWGPRSQLAASAVQAGWVGEFCPHHSGLHSGPWQVDVLSRSEQGALAAAAALTGAGARPPAPPAQRFSDMWWVTVHCRGQERAVQLAKHVFGVGAVAMCRPGRG